MSAPRPTPSFSARLRSLDLAILVAIVAVVVIVSLPRLSAFARHENEVDAQRLVRRLAQLFDDGSLESAPPADTAALFQRLPRASRRQFEDQSVVDLCSETKEGSRSLLLRHGYFFEFVRLPTFAGDTAGVLAVRAWPERRADAASPSYVGFSSTAVLRHAALTPVPGGADAPPQIASPLFLAMRAQGWELVSPTDAQ